MNRRTIIETLERLGGNVTYPSLKTHFDTIENEVLIRELELLEEKHIIKIEGIRNFPPGTGMIAAFQNAVIKVQRLSVNDALLGLCGMEYSPWSYTPEYWYNLTGINPLDKEWVQFFDVSSFGKIAMNEDNKRYCNDYFNDYQCTMNMLLNAI